MRIKKIEQDLVDRWTFDEYIDFSNYVCEKIEKRLKIQ